MFLKDVCVIEGQAALTLSSVFQARVSEEDFFACKKIAVVLIPFPFSVPRNYGKTHLHPGLHPLSLRKTAHR